MGLTPYQRPHTAPTTVAYTAKVVRADSTGVWVTPLDGDTRHPLGPCRGATRAGDTGPELLPVGTLVLLILTAHGPWVAAHHQEVP